MLFILPLIVDVDAYLTFEPIKVHFLLLGSGVVAAALALGILFKGKSLFGDKRWSGWGWGTIGFYGYFGSFFISSFTSIAPHISFWGGDPRYHGLVFYLAMFVVVSAVTLLGSALYRRLLNVILCSAIVVSIFGILQQITPSLNQWWDISSFLNRAYSTLGHPNYLASFLVLVTPLFFWKFLESRWKYSWMFGGIFVIAALILTMSRSGFIGLLVSLFFFILVYSWWMRRLRIFMGLMMIPLLFGFIMMYVNIARGTPTDTMSAVNSQTLISRFAINQENLRSVESRSVLWSATWKLILERPWFGYGLDTFSLAFTRVAPPELLQTEDMNSYADRAHNILLDTLVEVGVVGTIFWLMILVSTVVVAVRSRDVCLLALGSAVVGEFVMQQFGFQVATDMTLMWIFVVGILIMRKVRVGVGEVNTRARFIYTCVCVPALIFWGVWSSTFALSSWKADRFARTEDFEAAHVSAPYLVKYELEMVNQGLQSSDVDAHLRRLEQETGGSDFHVFWYRGRVHVLRGEYDQSYADFEHTLALAPTALAPYLDYGKALYAGGRYTKAVSIYQRYLDLAPGASARTRIFYKLNPDFDQIFELLKQAKARE